MQSKGPADLGSRKGLMTEGLHLDTTPQNLAELLRQDQDGYELRTAYFLELEHGLMGFFPAVFRGSTRIVITLDRGLLEEIWKTLSPRRSKMRSNSFMVNGALGIGFPILPGDEENSKPQCILTRQAFELLPRDTFEWAPGLIANDMCEDEFLRTLEVAREMCGP